jgi:hypothetical protein
MFETLDRAAPPGMAALIPRFHPDRRHGGGRATDLRQWGHLTPWLLPREAPAAMLFCPLCIGDGPVVYPRLAWSLALTLVCRRHKVILRDSCPACGEAVLQGWVRRAPQGWAYCLCGAALALAPIVPAAAPVLWLADQTHTALTTGHVALEASIPMPARTYFAIVRTLVESVRLRWARQPWAESCWRRLGVDPLVMRPQLAVPFEVQPLPWRLRILELGRASPAALAPCLSGVVPTGVAHRPGLAASRAGSARSHVGAVGGSLRGPGSSHSHTVPDRNGAPGLGSVGRADDLGSGIHQSLPPRGHVH